MSNLISEGEYDNNGLYKKGTDPEVTCWHCQNTFLCDPMDAVCRLCNAPYDKNRCTEFNFTPTTPIQEEVESKDSEKETFEYALGVLPTIAWTWDIFGHGELVASIYKDTGLWHRILTKILFRSKWTKWKNS